MGGGDAPRRHARCAAGEYHYRNESLGYDGRVKLLTAIVQADRQPGEDVAKTPARGTVDFDLPDLPATQQNAVSIGIQSWKADRESFVYDADNRHGCRSSSGRGGAIAEKGVAFCTGCWTTLCRSDCSCSSPPSSGVRSAYSDARDGDSPTRRKSPGSAQERRARRAVAGSAEGEDGGNARPRAAQYRVARSDTRRAAQAAVRVSRSGKRTLFSRVGGDPAPLLRLARSPTRQHQLADRGTRFEPTMCFAQVRGGEQRG